VAELRHVEAESGTIRQAHHAAGDHVNRAQAGFYEASAEVGRLEAETASWLMVGCAPCNAWSSLLSNPRSTRGEEAAVESLKAWPGSFDAEKRPNCFALRWKQQDQLRRRLRKHCARPRPRMNARVPV
jgi:chromosome segregation protein